MPTRDHDELFDRFLTDALSPPEGLPDQAFVDRVRQQVRLDEALRARRSRIFHRLGIELLSLVALGCALAAIGSSPPVEQLALELPHFALGGLLVIFVAWVPLVASPSRRSDWT
jgi:hypothetical protein